MAVLNMEGFCRQAPELSHVHSCLGSEFPGSRTHKSLAEFFYSKKENPRLCRGGSSSLTFPGVDMGLRPTHRDENRVDPGKLTFD